MYSLSEQNRQDEARQTENIMRAQFKAMERFFRQQLFSLSHCSLTLSNCASPHSRIGSGGNISILYGCFNQGFPVERAYKLEGVRRSSPFGPLLSPAKLMIISYHDQVFQEPGFGTRTMIYQPMMDLQSSQSPIHNGIKDHHQYFFIYLGSRLRISASIVSSSPDRHFRKGHPGLFFDSHLNLV